MVHFPHNGNYLLMNADSGYYLLGNGLVGPAHYPSLGGIHPSAKSAVPKVKVLNSDSNSRIIKLSIDKNLFHFNHSSSGTKLTTVHKSHIENSGKHHWIVTDPGLSGVWRSESYLRLQNVYSGLYLDQSTEPTGPDNKSHRAIGRPYDGRARQLWKFIPIPTGWDTGDVNDVARDERDNWKDNIRDGTSLDHALAAGNDYTYAPAQPQFQYWPQAHTQAVDWVAGGQVQRTGPALCGDPECGRSRICDADYNRIVRPMGYSGVSR
ncbi:hypothetical protein BDV10DRAFT_175786 [Aspergillus recurvatus]